VKCEPGRRFAPGDQGKNEKSACKSSGCRAKTTVKIPSKNRQL
jgi:hypothetical protein